MNVLLIIYDKSVVDVKCICITNLECVGISMSILVSSMKHGY
jgi:hypothetical protein